MPFRGYLDADDRIRERVDRFFNVPMLIMALLVLPLLAAEYYTGRESFDHPLLQNIVLAAAAFIWFAFLVEFVVKIAIAQSRAQYAVRNWVDIVIILLPMLRVVRGARILRAGRLVKVTRASRMLRLKGVAIKLARATAGLVLGLEFIARIRRRYQKSVPSRIKPDYKLWARSALITEIERLNRRVQELEAAQEQNPGHEGEPPPD